MLGIVKTRKRLENKQANKECFGLPQIKKAGDGNRTHISSLEGWCSTTELHPQNMYYSIFMPWTGIEPVTRGFSVLCSTN